MLSVQLCPSLSWVFLKRVLLCLLIREKKKKRKESVLCISSIDFLQRVFFGGDLFPVYKTCLEKSCFKTGLFPHLCSALSWVLLVLKGATLFAKFSF